MSDLIYGLDVSSYQPRDLSQLIAQLQPQHIVSKLYQPEESIAQAHSIAQIYSCQHNGVIPGGYWWGYRDLDPKRSVGNVVKLCESFNFAPPVLWCDIEPYRTNDNVPGIGWIVSAREETERLGYTFGIYSGYWVWQLLGFPTELDDAYAWLAEYNGKQTMELTHVHGLSRVVGHQWTSKPVDQNVWLPEAVGLSGEVSEPAVPTLNPNLISDDLHYWVHEIDKELNWIHDVGIYESPEGIKEAIQLAKEGETEIRLLADQVRSLRA